ncbi:hypothetical protein EQ875_03154 [Photobacterium damselae subsp. damselae]|uniref:Uncharacterized protein n=1 Tax=Photobacterium damselae TaxID=38293 RepID=A0A2X1VZZ6_PHODM|nr:hypothetical protein EQ875_03154 [Photobacterium damselae subsp. damselae]SPY24429.1 Uncharacterised protein [Photobacterium damselae]SPY28026.1 Uncharacterised protein [Photobacterium damselae]SUB66500.1 Uncharacterised protein [Photobacterium damselae]
MQYSSIILFAKSYTNDDQRMYALEYQSLDTLYWFW